jgi:hypothetical protein
MQVWIVCLVLFFGATEFYQWAKGLELPLPVLVASGVLLAIASNLRSNLASSIPPKASPPAPQPAAIAAAAQPLVTVESVEPIASLTVAGDRRKGRSISFKIKE